MDRLLTWVRPIRFGEVAAVHLPLALVSGVPLLLAAWVPLKSLPLIPCTFLLVTGLPCPFCGTTRAFWAMGQGDWTGALQLAPLGVLVYLAAAVLFAWNGAALLWRVRLGRGPALRWGRKKACRLFAAAGLALLLHWIYRLAA